MDGCDGKRLSQVNENPVHCQTKPWILQKAEGEQNLFFFIQPRATWQLPKNYAVLITCHSEISFSYELVPSTEPPRGSDAQIIH